MKLISCAQLGLTVVSLCNKLLMVPTSSLEQPFATNSLSRARINSNLISNYRKLQKLEKCSFVAAHNIVIPSENMSLFSGLCLGSSFRNDSEWSNSGLIGAQQSFEIIILLQLEFLAWQHCKSINLISPLAFTMMLAGWTLLWLIPMSSKLFSPLVRLLRMYQSSASVKFQNLRKDCGKCPRLKMTYFTVLALLHHFEPIPKFLLKSQRRVLVDQVHSVIF